MVRVGQRVREVVTGITGTVTGRVVYITGCAQVLVQPPCIDGRYTDSMWFDETRCEILEVGTITIPHNNPVNGPDKPAPKK